MEIQIIKFVYVGQGCVRDGFWKRQGLSNPRNVNKKTKKIREKKK